MKVSSFLILFVMSSSPLFPQSVLKNYIPDETLTADQCFEIIKTVWDGLKQHSEEYHESIAEKNEFESTDEYRQRLRKSKDDYIAQIKKFYSDNQLSTRVFNVWLKATLVKYDADNQTYGITSPTEILVQPKKKNIVVVVPPNKYLNLTEKDAKGYRRAYVHLNTNPEFTWFVNKQTAMNAKNNEHNIFFKLSFNLDVTYDDATGQIVLHIVPNKISLMNQSDKFIYWTDTIR